MATIPEARNAVTVFNQRYRPHPEIKDVHVEVGKTKFDNYVRVILHSKIPANFPSEEEGINGVKVKYTIDGVRPPTNTNSL